MFTRTTASNPLRRRVILGTAGTLAALSFGIADAHAATVGRIFGDDLKKPGNITVVYDGSHLEDKLTVSRVPGEQTLVFEDPTQVITPTDSTCVQDTPHRVRCLSVQGEPSGGLHFAQIRLYGGDDQGVIALHDNDFGVSINGGDGADTLTSGEAGHALYGGNGNDVLRGNGGEDVIYGNAGADDIDGGAGMDALFGDGGSDTIHAQDGEVDEIDCGGGIDTLSADADDIRGACELTSLKLAPPSAPPADGQPAAPADPSAQPADAGAPAPAAVPAAPATRSLQVGVTVRKLTRSGRLVVLVRCPKSAAGTCRVTLTGRGVAPRTVSVKAGAARSITLKLTGAARRSASKGRRVGVRLSVRAADGQVRAAARTLRIARRAR